MALLFMDDFDHYTTTKIIDNYYSVSAGTLIVSGGRNSTNCLKVAYSAPIYKNFSTIISTGIIGFAIKLETGTVFQMTYLIDGNNQAFLSISAPGYLKFYNYPGGALIATGTTPISADEWYYIEIKCKLSSSDGTLDARINGVQDAGFASSGDLAYYSSDGFNSIRINQGGAVAYIYLDDLYVADATGANNNDYLGDNRVESILPSGAGYITQWTPSAGSNYENVDDPASSSPCPDDDTTYNTTALAANKDSFAMGNMVSTSGTIAGVQLSFSAKKDDAGTKLIRGFVRISGTNYYTDTFTLLDTYKYYTYIWQISPATSSPWAISEVNAAEFGYELVS